MGKQNEQKVIEYAYFTVMFVFSGEIDLPKSVVSPNYDETLAFGTTKTSCKLVCM